MGGTLQETVKQDLGEVYTSGAQGVKGLSKAKLGASPEASPP